MDRDTEFLKDTLVKTAEGLLELSDKLSMGEGVKLNEQEQELFRIGTLPYVSCLLREARQFYLTNSISDLEQSFATILKLTCPKLSGLSNYISKGTNKKQ